MKFIRSTAIALCLGLTLAMLFGTTASAFTILKLTGNHGDFGTKPATSDGPDTPGAKCGYSAPDGMGVAHLVWMKVFPFNVAAYDRTSSTDSQSVKFQLTVQRSKNGGASWSNVGSTSQTRTTWDNKSAAYSTLKVSVTGKAGQTFRAMVTLTWLRNGNADGVAKLLMGYYGVKWTVGSSDFVYQDACNGAAD